MREAEPARWWLLVFSLRHFAPLVIGLALLAQTAVAALYGFSVFGEVFGAWDIAGMLMLGGAHAVARVKRPTLIPR